MQPKDIEIPEVSSTGLDLPPGFRPLPMPPEYYGFAAQNEDLLPKARPSGPLGIGPWNQAWTPEQDELWLKYLEGLGLDPMTLDEYRGQAKWGDKWEEMGSYGVTPVAHGDGVTFRYPSGGGSSPEGYALSQHINESQKSGALRFDPKKGYYWV